MSVNFGFGVTVVYQYPRRTVYRNYSRFVRWLLHFRRRKSLVRPPSITSTSSSPPKSSATAKASSSSDWRHKSCIVQLFERLRQDIFHSWPVRELFAKAFARQDFARIISNLCPTKQQRPRLPTPSPSPILPPRLRDSKVTSTSWPKRTPSSTSRVRWVLHPLAHSPPLPR